MNSELKKIAKITLHILSKKSWTAISLKEIQTKSKVKSFNNLIKSKKELLKNINVYFDYLLSLNIKSVDKSNHKDMIFEIIMMRFDILESNRKQILSIFDSFKKNPQEILYLLPSLLDSIIIMTKFANIPTAGLLGQLKIKGILLIYFSTFLIWVKDKSSSLEKTMTALDSYLDRAGKILKFIN